MEMHPPCKRISFVSILFVLALFKKSQSSRLQASVASTD
jgi:hypothetical protein